jgi:hypothetical protein
MYSTLTMKITIMAIYQYQHLQVATAISIGISTLAMSIATMGMVIVATFPVEILVIHTVDYATIILGTLLIS